MRIKNAQSALLSNHEVLLHLREQDAEYEGTDGTGRGRQKPKGFRDVLQDGLAYLQSQTQDHALNTVIEAHPERPMTLYKGEHSLYRVLAPKFRLNRVEYLMLYNLRPQTQIELQLVIEESGTRFTEDELEDMLALITQVFQEEEGSIHAGVEDQELEKTSNKLLGASKRKKRVRRTGAEERE
ncbi:hypothetical protein K491DRAFT_693620 [Lophiostoma macrostomum CBS 122681]|uniref:DNA-directed RNA polymerase III subunit RPC9 n=1 Tax=Lophiostoma macrostomum CBS 122681 TaxID=1314788 RepID=A0A6A6T6Y6_9PLEO|nr:hypothetical protein K491DRAFT_693620 [Lophiostoma macrostomum CBS 122681]